MRLFIFALLMCSCNAQHRFNRLVKKHPQFIDSLKTTVVFEKTFTETDTFIVKGDTISLPFAVLQRDTVFKSGRVTLRSKGGIISTYTKTDTFLQRDTLRIKETITISGKFVKRPWKTWEFIVFWLPIAVLGLMIYRNYQSHAR